MPKLQLLVTKKMNGNIQPVHRFDSNFELKMLHKFGLRSYTFQTSETQICLCLYLCCIQMQHVTCCIGFQQKISKEIRHMYLSRFLPLGKIKFRKTLYFILSIRKSNFGFQIYYQLLIQIFKPNLGLHKCSVCDLRLLNKIIFNFIKEKPSILNISYPKRKSDKFQKLQHTESFQWIYDSCVQQTS